MTKIKPGNGGTRGAKPAVQMERPAGGGSYVRNRDGSLTRVEAPAEPVADAETPLAISGAEEIPAAVGSAPAGESQEG